MEENKYYKPSLDELHIGFEFERLIKMKGGTMVPIEERCEVWDKEIINQHNLVQILTEWPNIIRVKYLDSEDIKSLGFTSDPSGERYFEFKWYQLYVDIHQDFNITIYNDNPIIVFQGRVKNKSELKRILKMIGVME